MTMRREEEEGNIVIDDNPSFSLAIHAYHDLEDISM